MLTRFLPFFSSAVLFIFMAGTFMAQTNDSSSTLNATQRGIVLIAAFTANGDLDKLTVALGEGLDAGLTVNEIKEILVQMYAYAGFPRSLNGINTFISILDARKAKGIVDIEGNGASPLPANMDKNEYGAKVRARLAGQSEIPPPGGYQLFVPIADTFLKEHLFADIFARNVLNHQQRELATIAALAAMSGTEGQLRFHLKAAMNTGVTEAQLSDFATLLDTRVSKDSARRAQGVLSEISKPAAREKVKIQITVDRQIIPATLEDSATVREFISLLPLTLTLEDYNETEKISSLSKKLTNAGAPAAMTPKAGDIAFYAPWGNLAIFYRDGHHSPGLIKLGTIDSNAEVFNVSGSLMATIEVSK